MPTMHTCYAALIALTLWTVNLSLSAQETSSIPQLLHRLAEDQGTEIRFEALIALSVAYEPISVDSAFYYSQAAYALAKEEKREDLKADANKQIGYTLYYQLNLMDSALVYFDRAEVYYKSVDDVPNMIRMNRLQGWCYSDKAMTVMAMKEYNENLKLSQRIGDKKSEANALNNIGEVYRRKKDSVRALEYLERADVLATSVADQGLKHAIKGNLALAYDLGGQSSKAIAILQEFIGEEQKKGILNYNLGRLYIKEGSYQAAEEHLNIASQDQAWMSVPRTKARTLVEYCTLYLRQGHFRKAISTGLESFELAQQIQVPEVIEDASRNLAQAYQGAGLLDSALYYQDAYIQAYKKLYDEATANYTIELDAIYKNSEKEKEILQLKNDKAYADMEHSRLLSLSMGVLFLVSTLVLVLLLIIKKKQHKETLALSSLKLKEEQLNRKELLLADFKILMVEKVNRVAQLEKQLEETTFNEQQKAMKIRSLTEQTILTEEDWDSFKNMFEDVYPNFFYNLKSLEPGLTQAELRISALMKLHLTNREIGGMLGISAESVAKAKYRLKKKLKGGETEDLEHLVLQA